MSDTPIPWWDTVPEDRPAPAQPDHAAATVFAVDVRTTATGDAPDCGTEFRQPDHAAGEGEPYLLYGATGSCDRCGYAWDELTVGAGAHLCKPRPAPAAAPADPVVPVPAAREVRAMGETCKGEAWNGWNWVGCSKPAKRDGFCGTHHPDAVAARKAKNEARLQVKRELRRALDEAHRERNRKADAYDALARRVAALEAALREHVDAHAALYEAEGSPGWNADLDSDEREAAEVQLEAARERAGLADREARRLLAGTGGGEGASDG
ncbi:MAG TPA: hypothetical protein VD948_05085 [Rhodothermales bacterium]|nr:hypothetical protein [Rhodothermales bacterium]